MEKKWSEWSEKLKTGGSQMTRLVTERVKEILQTPTPESKMVDEATLETMEAPNWSLNLRICGMINNEELNGNEVVRAIKRKIMGKSVVSRKLSLDLLETLSTNCDRVLSAVASEKVLDEMVKVFVNERENKAWELIRAWGQMDDLEYLPVFRQTYLSLQSRGGPPPVDDGNSHTSPYFFGPNVQPQGLAPPETYPVPAPPENYSVPDEGLRDADISDLAYHYSGLSLEQQNDYLTTARNSIEILSSILNADTEPKPLKEDLTVSLVEKCEQLLPIIQRIIETTTNDETMMFEALNMNDQLQQVISRYKELEGEMKSAQPHPEPQPLQPHPQEAPETRDNTRSNPPADVGRDNEPKLTNPLAGEHGTSNSGRGTSTDVPNEKSVSE